MPRLPSTKGTLHHESWPSDIRPGDRPGSGTGERARCSISPGTVSLDRHATYIIATFVAGASPFNASRHASAWSRPPQRPAWTRNPPSSLRSRPRVLDS